MLFSSFLALSTIVCSTAKPYKATYPPLSRRTPELYARAEVQNTTLGIHARFEFVGAKDGKPTMVKVRVLKGLANDSALGGPFGYHIHTYPIPPDGNCTKALGHHDPLNVTDGFICNAAFPQYCQMGELSGKHGKLNGTTDGKIATFEYSDAYLRFFPETHSLLGRSIVIHSSNKTRLACGNITSMLDGTADTSFKPTQKGSTFVKNRPSAPPVQPTPSIPLNGSAITDPAIAAALPYPLPVPALSLAEAWNVKLTNITHSVKFANTVQNITRLSEIKVDGSGPFSGW